MSSFSKQAMEFLTHTRIAVAGVSRSSDGTGNYIYKSLCSKGYQVFPIKSQGDELEGDKSYLDLKSIPKKIDGVIAVTRSEGSIQIPRVCVELGIPCLWMHENAFKGGTATSVSPEAVRFYQANGVEVIPIGCPMMFPEFGHKCMRLLIGVLGKLPQQI